VRRDIAERLDEAFGNGSDVRFFVMPRMDVSSTEVRRRVAAGRTIRYLVPDAVREQIARRGLYAGAVRA
jgi:nicotinate-nucleotide adenylyltransferase